MDTTLQALQSSVARLHAMVGDLDDTQLVAPAYPTDWNIADVLSHIGSGAVIMRQRLEDTLLGQPTPEDFAPGVWDTWNAKSPRSKAEDALVADQGLLDRIESLTASERSRFRFSLGPVNLDFDGFVGLRLNEHAFHAWDIEVALDPAAVVPPDAAAQVVDNLELIARFTAKPTGSDRSVAVRTIEPRRDFTITFSPDEVALAAGESRHEPDLVLPAEAFARLVYGRLDPDHTPSVNGDVDTLEELRRAFPGL
ncbi:MAG TPA: maleylpyruvate isomerase family mycothiol-dependent enzyme [Acidimicrobiales bacterium]